jgi:hypothetical protein
LPGSHSGQSNKIKIAVIESDPLRVIGFRAIFEAEPDMELVSALASELARTANADLIPGERATGSRLCLQNSSNACACHEYDSAVYGMLASSF